MKIDSYSIQQLSTSEFRRTEKSYVNIQIQQAQAELDVLDISEEGLALSEVEEEEDLFQLSDEDKRKIELIESFISWLTGKKFKFSKMYLKSEKGLKEKNLNQRDKKLPQGKAVGQNRGFGMRIHTMHEVYEKEMMTFSSSGIVKTSDGREINFSYNLNMSRETYERSELLLEIGEKFHDPLVLNFDGKGIDFDAKEIRIDIDLDGELDNINMLAKGSGFLALDLNNNGVVDDGTELFGPETNNGFGELSAYDLDGNMWIDENDDIFSSLKIWAIGEDGEETLLGLKDVGVGAIYLGNVASRYTIVNEHESLAKITGSSIYLSEDGDVNSIHELDLKL